MYNHCLDRHEKSESNCKELLSLRRRAGGEWSSQILSCCKPLNRLAARVEQENPGRYVEEGWRLPDSLPDEDVGAPLPGEPSRQFWVTPLLEY